jgi:hypothetical protein
MKKYLLIILTFVIIAKNNAQLIQASLGPGLNTSSIKIYLRPNITNAAVSISTLQFNVAIPSTVSPAPTLSLVSNSIAGVTWVISPSYVEGGYRHYNITNNQSPTFNCTSGVEFEALEVKFSGGPVGPIANTAHLVTLPDGGGGNANALFYCTSAVGGVLNSNGQNLYYARNASVIVANGDSYGRYTDANITNRPAGTFTSYAQLITTVTLPVKFASFFASKQNNDALLNWNVENQDANVKNFEIERSFTGINFTKIAEQNPSNATNGFATYNATDAGVFDNTKGNVYYRIKQIDHNGAITYSPIRILKSDNKAFTLTLFPNPVIKNATIAFGLPKAQQVTLQLVDALGKIITSYPLNANKGFNQKNIDVSSLANGTYTFIINTGTELEKIQFVKSN